MTAVMGPYEASLYQSARDRMRRMAAFVEPQAKPKSRTVYVAENAYQPPRRIEAKPSPAQTYTPIVHAIECPAGEDSPFRWRIIVDEVLAKHKVSMWQLCGGQRSRPIVAARFEAYYRLSQETSLSLPQIGRFLGGKDHTSVLHGIRKYRERLEAERAAA